MRLHLKNKNILITGGSKGIGKEISKKLAEKGANLFIVARDISKLEKTRAEVLKINPGINCVVYQADVSDKTQVKNAVKEMIDRFGSIDGLINNAGKAVPDYFENISGETFENLINIDYLGSVYFTIEVYPYLKPGDFVSFTSSVAGFMGLFGYTAYSGSKFALIGFAESLQQEFYLKNIQVSVLCPPDTETPGFEQEEKCKPYETKKLSGTAKLMKPEKVAEIFLRKLEEGRFLITVNFESAVLYFLHGIIPDFVRKIICLLLKKYHKEKSNINPS